MVGGRRSCDRSAWRTSPDIDRDRSGSSAPVARLAPVAFPLLAHAPRLSRCRAQLSANKATEPSKKLSHPYATLPRQAPANAATGEDKLMTWFSGYEASSHSMTGGALMSEEGRIRTPARSGPPSLQLCGPGEPSDDPVRPRGRPLRPDGVRSARGRILGMGRGLKHAGGRSFRSY